MRHVATKIFLAFAVALGAFGVVAAFGATRLHALGRELRLLSSGYYALSRIAAQIDVKDWVAARVLEARDLDLPARRASLPLARAHFPGFVREKIEEGKAVARDALALAGPEDARFLREVEGRLDVLGARWSEYDREARALLDALEAGGGDPRGAAAFDDRVQAVRTLERALSVDVKILQVELERHIAERVHATERDEARTVALIVILSLLAFAVGAGAALVSHRFLSPIATLTDGVKAVAAGDLSRKVDVRSRDELGILAREFNAMASSLERQQAELLRAERLAAVGRISAQITHEIRNPLNSIGLNAELLAEEIAGRPDAPREALQLVSAITREVDRLNGVTEEYLRFARLPRANLAAHDVNEILGGLLDFLAPELAASRVEVCRELAPGLPPVRADEGLLRAVFLNLVRNSREAMPAGGALTVRTGAPGGAVEIEVRDTGGGIPPDGLTRIFDPFYSTKERGTGLGLAFAQQVVKEHGGTIRCDSTVGRGTAFTIRLPAVAEERAGQAPPVEAASAT